MPKLTPKSFELVRVHDKADGVDAHRTVTRLVAESDTKRYEITDRPAVDRNGLPLPLKRHERATNAPTKAAGAAPKEN